jgi:hypothetical protein
MKNNLLIQLIVCKKIVKSGRKAITTLNGIRLKLRVAMCAANALLYSA